jgi:hypothetical protein
MPAVTLGTVFLEHNVTFLSEETANVKIISQKNELLNFSR